MSKWVKISIAAAIVLFIGVAVFFNMNGYNEDVIKESKKAFNIMDKAFQEERALTEYEEMELEKFIDMRDKAVDNFDDLKGKKKNDAVLLYAVGDLYDTYLVDMEAFKDRYKEVKILLE